MPLLSREILGAKTRGRGKSPPEDLEFVELRERERDGGDKFRKKKPSFFGGSKYGKYRYWQITGIILTDSHDAIGQS